MDSLGGTVQEAVLNERRVALVSHRSNSKVYSRQKKLVAGLHGICKKNPPIHVPVWVHQSGTEGREYTQRSRTFLYASLGAAVAQVFGLKRIRFYENGVVSLNLPISEQVVGARATRTTHPQVLGGFTSLFSLLVGEAFTVENPFLWITKTEVVNLIGDAGCGDLIGQSVSCTHTREQTVEKPHCGRCSQCISRKFATLASRFSNRDPDSLYRLDLLTGPRTAEKDRTLVESFIRTATQIGSMNELQVVEYYGEVSRVLRHVRPLLADQVAERVIQLYRRHSSDVTGVMDVALSAHASDIREGKLPATCAILLAIPESYKKGAADERRELPGLNERHTLAMAVKLDDRTGHWQSAYASHRPTEASNTTSRKAKKPVRRNQKYSVIDKALQEIAESRPRTQEEVFQSLDGRHVVIPPAEPFMAAQGWIAGFRRNPAAARAWLSKRWAESSLDSLPRGPKK